MLSLSFLERLATQALQAAGASPDQSSATARALVTADAQGLPSHGLSRMPMYAGHLRQGRVNGNARPTLRNQSAGAVLVDADNGFAFPACDLAVREAVRRAAEVGIAIAAVTNSHHFGAAAYHLIPVASAGMVGLAMGNSPAAMPVAGGKRAILGTNPLAAVFPRIDRSPVVIDLSLSEVARGKLMVAAQKGESIPVGWALDEQGRPTTDAKAGLKGSMLPFGSANGGVKGAMLALMIELLVTSLTGARFGAEADSFFEAEGNQPRLGQVFIVIDPAALGGCDVYAERVGALLTAMCVDEGVRVPGDRREALTRRASIEGLSLPETVLASLCNLAGFHPA